MIKEGSKKRIVRNVNGVLYISFPPETGLKAGNIVALNELPDGMITLKKVAD